MQRLRLLPLAPFRDSYAYTNLGLTAAAEAVATAAGTNWATLSEDALYRPLGMSLAVPARDEIDVGVLASTDLGANVVVRLRR